MTRVRINHSAPYFVCLFVLSFLFSFCAADQEERKLGVTENKERGRLQMTRCGSLQGD